MKRALLFAAVLFVVAPPGFAQRAKDSAECSVYADLALNAAAHAKHGITREKFDAMVPDLYVLKDDEQRELTRRIIDAAWSAGLAGAKPEDFANLLNRMCHSRRGDMDPILGVRL